MLKLISRLEPLDFLPRAKLGDLRSGDTVDESVMLGVSIRATQKFVDLIFW